jgi:antitoxin HicB
MPAGYAAEETEAGRFLAIAGQVSAINSMQGDPLRHRLRSDIITARMERRSGLVAENYSFSIVLEPQHGGGFTVLVPALPEVVTEGDTEEQALANAKEAIGAILAFRREHRLPIPADSYPEIRHVTVAAHEAANEKAPVRGGQTGAK